MLVLTRKDSEGIRFTLSDGRKIEIFISQCRSGLTSTQMKAPLDIVIERIDRNGNSQVKKK
tara:strand:+ start:4940 stop:5122 length:183 start_codon:yes stop_codon:yes gene_type:complete